MKKDSIKIPVRISVLAFKGDIMTSKKGFVLFSQLMGGKYLVKSIKVCGDDRFVAMSEKIPLKDKTKGMLQYKEEVMIYGKNFPF